MPDQYGHGRLQNRRSPEQGQKSRGRVPQDRWEQARAFSNPSTCPHPFVFLAVNELFLLLPVYRTTEKIKFRQYSVHCFIEGLALLVPSRIEGSLSKGLSCNKNYLRKIKIPLRHVPGGFLSPHQKSTVVSPWTSGGQSQST